jgi:hypothetical protein
VLVPVVRPKGNVWPADPNVFDRAVCAAGVKWYVRPASPAGEGRPTVSAGAGRTTDWVLVEEMQPGARCRLGLHLGDRLDASAGWLTVAELESR